MIIPTIIKLGGALLRIAPKQLPKYLKKGAEEIKKPSLSQRKKAVPAEPMKAKPKPQRGSPEDVARQNRLSQARRMDKNIADQKKGGNFGFPKKDTKTSSLAKNNESVKPKELNPLKDLTFKKGGQIKRKAGCSKGYGKALRGY